MADTVQVIVTPQNFAFVSPSLQVQSAGGPLVPTFVPGSTTMAPGGTVAWVNSPLLGGAGSLRTSRLMTASGLRRRLTRYSPLSAICTVPEGTGNIAEFGDTTTTMLTDKICRMRSFPVPGIYRYHSVATGATGQIVVTYGSSGS